MSQEHEIQVDKEHYFDNYDSFSRWISYFNQIKAVREFCKTGSTVLEIGIGNKTVYNYLSNQLDLEVTGMDLDENLDPDVVGDIIEIPFSEDKFDLVCAFEVLEHIPSENVPKAIEGLSRVSKDKVIISVPHKTVGVNLRLNWHYKIYFSKHLNIPIPLPKIRHEFDGQHHWELGSKEMTTKKFRELLQEEFTVLDSFRGKGNIYHHFYILETDN